MIGVAASLAAVAFVTVEHNLQHLLWQELPAALGRQDPPGWLVYALLLVGGMLVHLARRLPGDGGHEPLHGLGIDIGPKQVLSVMLAALASLAFGAVVGPEAPLMAIGTAVAASIAGRKDPTQSQILMLAGALAAVGMIFGNPLVTSLLLLETAALAGGPGGKTAVMKLLPALLALAFGYLVQVGVGNFGGFGSSVLAVPGLAPYPQVQAVDLLLAVPLALAVGVLAVVALQFGHAYHRFAKGRQLPGLLIAGAVVATCAVGVRLLTEASVDTVLFSGQAAIPEVLGITSAATLGVILVGKVIAYGVSVGGGFRGGLIFPAVYVGVVCAVILSIWVPDASQSALVAAGIGAGSAAALRLPFTSTLLAVALCGGAGGSVTSSAIIGAVIGLLVRAGLDQRIEARGGTTDDAIDNRTVAAAAG